MVLMIRLFLTTAFIFLVLSISGAQSRLDYGIGLTMGTDFYQRHVNPGTESSKKRRSSGNILLNPTIGPKFWLGNSVFSFSLESQINFGMTSFDVNEYKGMGALSFPIMGAFNFEGLSGLEALGVFGLSIGGGIQYVRTELYFQPEEHQSVNRDFFPVYFGQINLGIGYNGIAAYLYVRLGYGDGKARALHVGLMTDFNLRRVKTNLSEFKNIPIP